MLVSPPFRLILAPLQPGGIMVLMLALQAPASQNDPQEQPAIPAEQYEALVKEAEKAQRDFIMAYREAIGVDREKVEKSEPQFGPRFLALAKRYANDPIALDALVRVVMDTFPRDGTDPDVTKALSLLLRDHVASEKLAGVCEVLGNRVAQQDAETFLLAVLEKSPRKVVQAGACLALAERPHHRVISLEILKKNPGLSESSGSGTTQALQDLDVAQQMSECERYFRRFTDQYSGVLSSKRLSKLC